MAITRCRRTRRVRILLTIGFLMIAVYAIIIYNNTPNRLRKLKAGRRSVTDEYRSISGKTATLDDKRFSNKSARANKVTSNGVVNNKQFSGPIIRQYASRNSSTDKSIPRNTLTSNGTNSSNKATTTKKVSSNVVIHDTILLPFPPIKDYESRILDVNIDRVYGCGRKSMNVVRPKEERIPRIIHFMWTTEIIPSVFVENLKTFVKHNPTWTYYFWTAASSERFIKENYPHLLNTMKGYPLFMSRYDATKYVIIHHYGGAYFDLDTTCLKPLDPLLETEECIVAPEPMEHAVVVLHMRSVLGSCVFLCKPRHGFMAHVLTELDKSKLINDMMRAAGPIFFTNALRTYVASCLQGKAPTNESVHVMSGEYFLDKLKDDVHGNLTQYCSSATSMRTLYMSEACAKWQKRNAEHRTLSTKAYTVHLYFSTYFNKQLLDERPENNIKYIIPNVKIYPD